MSDPPSRFPTITAVEWLPARDVLGGEASDFTPWLQQPQAMEVLGTALKLEDLTAVSAEHNVLGKRLDILARALDENGEDIPVCIENQYGTSDASHLGRLIAYLAQHDHGRAVWVVENAHEAYIAAVRFLNRTSSDDVGYFLVQVRFTHGSGGSHQVHFEVLAAPLAWERGGRSRASASTGGGAPVNHDKVAYLEAIHEIVGPELVANGFPSTRTHVRGSYLAAKWPSDLWFSKYARRIDFRVTQSTALVALYVWDHFATREANTAAMEILRGQVEHEVGTEMPTGSDIEWCVGTSGGLREVTKVELTGAGYVGGDVVAAARWAAPVFTAWLDVLRRNPIPDLDAQVEAFLADSADEPDEEGL